LIVVVVVAAAAVVVKIVFIFHFIRYVFFVLFQRAVITWQSSVDLSSRLVYYVLCSQHFAYNLPFCVFEPPSGDLEATYDDYLKLIGKRVVDFLLVIIELFSLGVTAEVLRAIICSKSAISLQRGSVDPKFQVDVVAPTNHSFS